MAKRYYKVNEMVWVKPLNKKGKVVELDIPNLSVKLTYFESKGELKAATFKLEEIDKLFSKNSQEEDGNKTNKKDTVLFAKVKPDAVIPSKRHEDGCYDIYACPDVKTEPIIILPFQIVTVPTGIASSMLPKYRFSAKRERGSTGSIGLVPRCGEIDSGYRGEWFIKLQNMNADKAIVITHLVNETVVHPDRIEYPITKAICQAALEIVPDVNTKEISYEALKKIPSERGTGKLGSSGK